MIFLPFASIGGSEQTMNLRFNRAKTAKCSFGRTAKNRPVHPLGFAIAGRATNGVRWTSPYWGATGKGRSGAIASAPSLHGHRWTAG